MRNCANCRHHDIDTSGYDEENSRNDIVCGLPGYWLPTTPIEAGITLCLCCHPDAGKEMDEEPV